ncbi:MAG: 2-iminoacetate synthase ThiH, partial [Phascolarctobacterium sp.]|nr:2-iminoacetate synthase ThiH [Phascolarctobacterium sp.]
MEDKFFNTTIYNEESRLKALNLVDDYMEYQDGMELLPSLMLEQVQDLCADFDPENFTEADVRRALSSSKR